MEPLVTYDRDPSNCKGLVFRGYNSTFISGNYVGKHQGIKLLKKKSCPGCEKCDYLLDEINESVACGVLEMDEIEHGELYSVSVKIDSIDYETGYADNWHAHIYKLESNFIGPVKP